MTDPTPARERLPNRRQAITFEFEVNGLRYTATVAHFADGRLAEIFLNNHKNNSAADVAGCGSMVSMAVA